MVPLCYSSVNMLVFSQCFVVMSVPSSSGWWQFVVAKAEVAQHFLVVLYWVLNRNFGDLEEITDRFSLVLVLWGISHLALFCKLSMDAAAYDSALAIRRAQATGHAPGTFIPMRTCSAIALGISQIDMGTPHFDYFLLWHLSLLIPPFDFCFSWFGVHIHTDTHIQMQIQIQMCMHMYVDVDVDVDTDRELKTH